MRPVHIDQILAQQRMDVDVYIRLGETKFILVAKAGLGNPVEQLAKYKGKNVHYLWVREADFATMVRQTISVAGMVVQQKGVGDASKLTVIEQAATAVFKECESMGLNELVYGHAKMVTEATIVLIDSNPQLAKLSQLYQSADPDLARHSMMVSVVSVMLGVGHNWIKAGTLEKLALGGFLHDIGKTKLPDEILKKHSTQLTSDERIIYKSHCEVGKQMVSSIKDVPDDVLLMIYEHHEYADGSGFPKGIKDFQMSPLARVVALANEYVQTLESRAHKNSAHAARRVYEEIEVSRGFKFNRDAMKALKKMLEVEDKSQAAG